MKTTVSTKGQIVLPAELRQRDGIAPGQEFEVERLDADEYRLRRVKGYFVAIDSESTDTL